jgi:outer membrane lipoprotein carrier protein
MKTKTIINITITFPSQLKGTTEMRLINLIKVTLLTIFLSSPIALIATPADQLSKLLANFQSMTANFEQVVYDENSAPLQTSTGNMALKRPGKFLWKTQEPIPQLLLTNGDVLWIYDIDLEQATEQKMDTDNESNPASLLSGSIHSIEQRFAVSDVNKPGNEKWFRLAPKDDSDMFQWIELGFLNGKLQSMVLNDKLGTLSNFTFSNVKINPNLNTSMFNFKAPARVEVLKN